MGYIKSSSKREFYSNTGLLQETNNPKTVLTMALILTSLLAVSLAYQNSKNQNELNVVIRLN